MGIVVLGVSGVKIGKRRRFGYFGGGELETTDLGSGMGVHSSMYPHSYGFSKHMCWGFTYGWRT
jgi:hypothetical protein